VDGVACRAGLTARGVNYLLIGALGGGWAATRLFHVHSLQGFFDLSTWLTAIAGTAVLLLAYHLVSGRSGGSRRFAHR